MFNIQVPTPTAEEAFSFLSSQVRRIDWFLQNNRPNRLEFLKSLNHPLINEMLQEYNRSLSKQEFQDKYFTLFQKDLYNPSAYAPLIEYTKNAVEKLQPCFERIQTLSASWGLEILPHYQVDINMFGVGGSYYRNQQNTGHIITGLRMPIKNPPEVFAHLIGHEIIHLGIEDLVINPNHTNPAPVWQEEKERIVDNLCIYAMQGILPLDRQHSNGSFSPYQEVAQHCAYMDNVVNPQPATNLVTAVKAFLKERGRGYGKEQ